MKLGLLSLAILLSGCAARSSVEQLTQNEYRISTQGSAFHSKEAIEESLHAKAKEICTPNDYQFIKNWLGDYISYQSKNETVYLGGVNAQNMESTNAVAKIKCI